MEVIQYYRRQMHTPIGVLSLLGSTRGLYAILWENEATRRVKIPINIQTNNEYPLFLQTEKQLKEYFLGTRKQFDLPLDHNYGTPFQQIAWKALSQIPYGQVRTYAQQAALVGNSKAVRAIGSANGKNPLSIVVPCHRVIASSGKLGGFAGGLQTKQYLLELEKLHL